jgi:tetratricopeptide (TPR) repeat protein
MAALVSIETPRRSANPRRVTEEERLPGARPAAASCDCWHPALPRRQIVRCTRTLAFIVLTGTSSAAASASTSAPSFADCIQEYRQGDIKTAVANVREVLAPGGTSKTMTWPSQIAAWLEDVEGRRDVRSLEAALMLVSEAYVQMEAEEGAPSDVLLMLSPTRRYLSLIERLHAGVVAQQQSPLLRQGSALRHWYLYWESNRQGRATPADSPDYLAIALRRFPNDPELLLALGARHEVYWWTGAGNPQRHPEGKGSGNTAHLRSAVDALRRSVATRPSNRESHLRLGRVLFLLGEHEAAARELRPVLSADDDPAFRYLANLFLGEVLVRQGDRRGAATAFAAAIEMVPVAQSARLAAARLELLDGQREAAAAAVDAAFSSRDEGADPWWWYVRGIWWQFANYRDAARAMVRQ